MERFEVTFSRTGVGFIRMPVDAPTSNLAWVVVMKWLCAAPKERESWTGIDMKPMERNAAEVN